jgi:hypothetical protein
MRNEGGDLSNVTVTECEAKCDQMEQKGCVAFVRPTDLGDTQRGVCLLRQKANASQVDIILSDALLLSLVVNVEDTLISNAENLTPIEPFSS